ncbi:MAG: YkvA family protein [Syntrophotaleaceae bacterium]
MPFEGLNYPELWKKAEKHYENGLPGVDLNDLVYAANKGKAKLEGLGNPPEGLEDLWEDLHHMVDLCRDYHIGIYKDISWDMMQKIAGAVAYFVTPFDLVPDVLPKIGYLDDAAVIQYALKGTRNDLDGYLRWRRERNRHQA